jgi:hypothetical protein
MPRPHDHRGCLGLGAMIAFHSDDELAATLLRDLRLLMVGDR